MILDSGNRTEFTSGAVRDIQEGKGRCDLLPLDALAVFMHNDVLLDLADFQLRGQPFLLLAALRDSSVFESYETMALEVAVHMEDGAKKYGERNWQRGIPLSRYVDSAVRHYLKHLRGDTDERHDRAFCWNVLCAYWTCKHKPELNEYAEEAEMSGYAEYEGWDGVGKNDAENKPEANIVHAV